MSTTCVSGRRSARPSHDHARTRKTTVASEPSAPFLAIRPSVAARTRERVTRWSGAVMFPNIIIYVFFI